MHSKPLGFSFNISSNVAGATNERIFNKSLRVKLRHFGITFTKLLLLCNVLSLFPKIVVCNLEGVEEGEGNSYSIYDTLKGFVNELGNVMKDIKIGVDKVATGIQSVEDILDATLDEECVFQCQNNYNEIHPNPDHIPTSNGCGSFGLENYLTQDMIPFLTKFVDCCNEHDICYGTCLNDKDLCDLKFRKCLYRKCALESETLSNKLKQKGCKAGAKILYTGTASLGCKPYINAQKEACLCRNEKKKSQSRKIPNKDEF